MSSSADKLASNLNFKLIGQAQDLKARIFFTLIALVIYRIGTYIPLPGINPLVIDDIMNRNSGGILGMFNMFSGGAFGRMTIFALNIMPYITSSIIMQLLTVISPNLESLKKTGESGRKKISYYTKCLTLVFGTLQGVGIAYGLESMQSGIGSLVIEPGMFFRIFSAITLVSGTFFLMWLGDQINSRGIGNGISLIIFAGIVAELPSAVASLFSLGRSGALSTIFIISIMVIAVLIILFIVFMERAHRRILVQYPKWQKGNKVFSGESSHIPLKLNTSGVIPPIFASSILLFPATLAGFSNKSEDMSPFLEFIIRYISHGRPLYVLLYVVIIVFFCFFYTSIVFNPTETADNIKKNGGFVPGYRPGSSTANYFDYVLSRLTVLGSLYLALVCALPEILISNYSVPFYLGGTSLLIAVSVVLDTVDQVQTHLFAHQYEGLIKKSKFKKRGKKK